MALAFRTKDTKMIRQHLAFFVFLFGGIFFAERYPFTRFPMYNEFPNYSYVFYISDLNNKPLALAKLGIGGGELAHNYFAIANARQFPNGKNLETSQHLRQIGYEMARIIRQKKPNFKVPFQIHRLYFYKSKNQLKRQDRVIYTAK
jgi:hypothetical protein